MLLLACPSSMVSVLVAVGLFLCTCLRIGRADFNIDDRDGQLTTPALIKKNGYRVRPYTITTADGYRLTMFRMQRKTGPNPKLLPVLLVHGLLGSSADWVILGPGHSLPYLLADVGYDVWLGNTRGVRYSRQHQTLSPEEADFWDFSWHEKGMFDLPAMIDSILNETATPGQAAGQLYYIGFSEGGTAYFVMTSSLPAYNGKIRQAHTLGPAVLLKEVRSPLLQTLVGNAPALIPLARSTRMAEMLPWSEANSALWRNFCPSKGANFQCTSGFSSLFGPNPASLDSRVVHIAVGHIPAGAALKEAVHFYQTIKTGIFRPYYEEADELPDEPYNLSASTAPVFIYYGLNDYIVHPRNLQQVASMLPNVRRLLAVGGKKFTHIDFVLGKRVKTALYRKILFSLRNDTKRGIFA